jgi:hypothetical protein
MTNFNEDLQALYLLKLHFRKEENKEFNKWSKAFHEWYRIHAERLKYETVQSIYEEFKVYYGKKQRSN